MASFAIALLIYRSMQNVPYTLDKLRTRFCPNQQNDPAEVIPIFNRHGHFECP